MLALGKTIAVGVRALLLDRRVVVDNFVGNRHLLFIGWNRLFLGTYLLFGLGDRNALGYTDAVKVVLRVVICLAASDTLLSISGLHDCLLLSNNYVLLLLGG